MCFHQGATAPGQAGIVRGDRARLKNIVDEQLSILRAAAGQHRAGHHGGARRASRAVTPTAAVDRPRRQRCPGADARDLRRRPTELPGVVRVARRRGPVLLVAEGGPVRRPGHHRALLRRQTQPRPAVPTGPGGVAVAAVRGREDLRPSSARPATTTTPRSGTGTTRTGPACRRPAGSSGTPCTCSPTWATTPSPSSPNPRRRRPSPAERRAATRRGPASPTSAMTGTTAAGSIDSLSDRACTARSQR